MTLSQDEKAQRLFQDARTVAFLTGAGASTESGIPDFKTADQKWPFKVRRAEAISSQYMYAQPKKFWEAYRYLFQFKEESLNLQPNRFHQAVAALESDHEVVVLTQNVDGLHSKAGSTVVGELHGNNRDLMCSRVLKGKCSYRGSMNDFKEEALPKCPDCGRFLRPDTVLFGEAPRKFGDAKQVCLDADLLVVAGTALDVGPVNDLPRYREWFTKDYAPILWVNRDQSPTGYNFTASWLGELSEFASLLSSMAPAASLPPLDGLEG